MSAKDMEHNSRFINVINLFAFFFSCIFRKITNSLIYPKLRLSLVDSWFSLFVWVRVAVEFHSKIDLIIEMLHLCSV